MQSESPWLCTVDLLPCTADIQIPHAGSPGLRWGEISTLDKRSYHAVPYMLSIFGEALEGTYVMLIRCAVHQSQIMRLVTLYSVTLSITKH